MATLPIVGIPLRPEANGTRLYQYTSYINAVSAAGGAPLGIPMLASDDALRVLYDRCDALLFAGGPDVDPVHYGEEVDPDCKVESVPALDRTELTLARWATVEDRPVLGICRGAQLINVALGGSLYQDIAVQHGAGVGHDHHGSARDLIGHTVTVEPGTVLARAASTRTLGVNSLHHQAIRRLADGLVVSACAPDGIIEGAEDPARRFLVLVQPHPEELVGGHAWARRLFDELVAAAG